MDMTLTAKLLPAALICKGFINGMADCDYEIYLREVVNASVFLGKNPKEKNTRHHQKKRTVNGIVFPIVTHWISN